MPLAEAQRAGKQAFRVEDIRVRRYKRLQNMIAIAAPAVHFVRVWLGEGLTARPEKLAILAHHALKTPPSAGLFLIPNSGTTPWPMASKPFWRAMALPFEQQKPNHAPISTQCCPYSSNSGEAPSGKRLDIAGRGGDDSRQG